MGLASLLLHLVASVMGPEPYGGCDEAWQAPDSPGARHCALLGAAVRSS